MKSKNIETNRWMKAEALKVFRNFLAHSKQYDHDMFAPPVEFISEGLWRRSIRRAFTAEELKAAEVIVDSSNLRETLHRLVNRGATSKKGLVLLEAVVDAAIEKFEAAADEKEVFRSRLQELGDTLKLSELERRILFIRSVHALDDMFWSTPHERRSERRQDALRDIARALDVSVGSLKEALSEGAKLLRYGVLDGEFDLSPRISDFLTGFNDEPFSSAYYEKDTGETLPFECFSKEIREHAERIRRLMTSARGKSPVNVLLYGVPGTGKTSLARTLAKEMGRDCYFVVQSDTNRNGVYCKTPPAFRYGAVLLCDGQVNPEKSVLVVDEADDLLNCRGDKGLLNSVLDEVTTPIIWIANSDARELDVSNRRRFDYSIRFKKLNMRERLMIWKNCVKWLKGGSIFTEQQLENFAARYEVSAGGIARVLENVLRQRPHSAEKAEKLVAEYMAPHCELLGIKQVDEKLLPAKDYSLEGLNIRGSVKLEDILSAVKKYRATSAEDCPDRPRMNILLSGAPGTGKTEFVKYLAATLNQKLIVKMGSDLLGPFVGQTEARIREAFREAEEENRVLFFDEVDGIVNSRANAQASWETTKVNEVLHQMENFNGIFIAATNYMKNLDEAVMRRFTFRLTFDWLAAQGKTHFWEVFFKTPLTDSEREELLAIPQLTPADFRNVRQRFFYLDRPVTNAERLAALREEVAVKPRDSTESHIGF